MTRMIIGLKLYRIKDRFNLTLKNPSGCFPFQGVFFGEKGEKQMKKLFIKIMFLALIVFVPSLVMAEVDVKVRINIPLPPPIVFPVPPHVVVIPETDVYAVPDVEEDIFFYGGWWWRPWEGRWYRSRYYDRGWAHYRGTPYFHRHVPPGWRGYYREHRWKGHEWDYRPIPHREAEKKLAWLEKRQILGKIEQLGCSGDGSPSARPAKEIQAAQ